MTNTREVLLKIVTDTEMMIAARQSPTLHISKQCIIQGIVEPIRAILDQHGVSDAALEQMAVVAARLWRLDDNLDQYLIALLQSVRDRCILAPIDDTGDVGNMPMTKEEAAGLLEILRQANANGWAFTFSKGKQTAQLLAWAEMASLRLAPAPKEVAGEWIDERDVPRLVAALNARGFYVRPISGKECEVDYNGPVAPKEPA